MGCCDHDHGHEGDETTRWDRFLHWFNTAAVPINRVFLVVGLIAIGINVTKNNYDLWFGFSVAVTLWSLYDIMKHHAARINVKQERPIGPEDTPEWSNNNKQG